MYGTLVFYTIEICTTIYLFLQYLYNCPGIAPTLTTFHLEPQQPELSSQFGTLINHQKVNQVMQTRHIGWIRKLTY